MSPSRPPWDRDSFAVAVPTRNRPGKLIRCLEALQAARQAAPCIVYVCDSSTTGQLRDEVRGVCRDFPFVRLRFHQGTNVPAARNACARAVQERLLINVDDDIQVEPQAIRCLLERYQATSGPRVVGGYTAWDGVYKGPIKLRSTGWGRRAEGGEEPDFLVGAFFLYPRQLALVLPWYERGVIPKQGWGGDDRMMGAVWRSHGIRLLAEPRARAVHDPQRGHQYQPEDQALHIFVNLFDAAIANPKARRLLTYELLGFATGIRAFVRSRSTATAFLTAWWQGHRALLEHRRALATLIDDDIPRSIWSDDPATASPAGPRPCH